MGNGTSIGKVRGLGSAHHGSHHWLLQRFTAIGNIVLGLFLAVSLALLPSYDFATVRDWLSQPLPAAALAIWIVNVFWHARLGLQVLVEDYVHTPGNKFAAIAALNILAVAGAGFGLFSIVRIALGGAA
ncbi:succinate dehydrogenase, hydrophobic membrane anchor protein [Tsuneonella sp. YG55]|uniref:Succinate dehydrogenase hydrophobic membrane anchor subunit n=1 Tax=Tsuneonella litorea TaxID=2976475 RepID=A0A9X3AKD3_9SPHN|nr:succinate dehydrogenase, hydrophobic membrane anchor protein [Tsuneonella litorea]MCT2558214.1 succinate dehydrogenase, hydrophobic membrane anchor protein [Tsuneonella litorea]